MEMFQRHELYGVDYACLLLPHASYWIAAVFFHLCGPRWLASYQLQPGGHGDPAKQRVSKRSVVATVMAQHAVTIALNWALMAFVDGSCALRPWPALHVALVHVALGMLMIDAWLYWMHRLFHRNRWLYHSFHAWHHRVHAPYAFAAQYNHPVEGLLLDITSGLIPLLALRMDARVAALLFSFTTIKIVDDHSGYELPWDPLQRLFPNNARFHDLHHQPKYARFNLSQPFFTHWDAVGGTLPPPAANREGSGQTAKAKIT
eukprot:g954.t1